MMPKQKRVIRTLRARRRKSNSYDNGNQELCDLTADPHETRNLAADPKARAVKAEMEGLAKCVARPHDVMQDTRR